MAATHRRTSGVGSHAQTLDHACSALLAAALVVPGSALATQAAAPSAPSTADRASSEGPAGAEDRARRADAEADTRPNVVMMVVDDMRVDELRYMPRTQRLLGDRGVQFANSFAPYPLCCPARASFFTGQYTHNHRVFNVRAPYAFPALATTPRSRRGWRPRATTPRCSGST